MIVVAILDKLFRQRSFNLVHMNFIVLSCLSGLEKSRNDGILADLLNMV